MRERGMIFNADMVRAVLNGSKTQTRRIVRHQPCRSDLLKDQMVFPRNKKDYERLYPTGLLYPNAEEDVLKLNPFGAVGDRLWVRETFQGPLFDYDSMDEYQKDSSRFEKPEFCVYAADGNRAPEFYNADDELCCRWRPSIHMPRWASRITLEITGVRVERLNSISEQDAAAEGVGSAIWFDAKGVPEDEWSSLGEHGAEKASHINCFASLWESIYGEESWQANPWVWVIEFKRVEGGSHD